MSFLLFSRQASKENARSQGVVSPHQSAQESILAMTVSAVEQHNSTGGMDSSSGRSAEEEERRTSLVAETGQDDGWAHAEGGQPGGVAVNRVPTCALGLMQLLV